MLSKSLLPALLCLLQFDFGSATNSGGCGKSLPYGLTRGGVGKSNKKTITTSDGTKRSYLLHVPTEYDISSPAPVVFSFHGRGGTGAGQEDLTRLSDESWNPDMIAVYPDGLDNCWEGDPDADAGVSDVSFVLELLEQLEDDFCIDTSRVYSSGHSNGGGFSLNILACDATASTKVAAFMGSSPATYQKTPSGGCSGQSVPITCTPGRNHLPIMSTHGTADDTIAYKGGSRRGECIPSESHFMTEWARRDQFYTGNFTTSLHDGKVTMFEYGQHLSVRGTVTHYKIDGLGHNWPRKDDGGIFDATPVVLEWMRQYTLP